MKSDNLTNQCFVGCETIRTIFKDLSKDSNLVLRIELYCLFGYFRG